jgi:DNA polymerase-3 subunit epsilon
MLSNLLSLDHHRRRLAAKSPSGPLQEYLTTPFPTPSSDCRHVEYLALDLETTGLDPARDVILSMGWVVVRGNLVDLSSAQHRLVRPSIDIPESSAVIHMITDDAAAQGEALESALAALLKRLAGRVLIAHHAKMEVGFIKAACARLFNAKFIVPTVDTLKIAKDWLDRRGQTYRSGDLRLDALRARYNLPRYRAHDALSDALAAAELFLAMIAERNSEKTLPLGRFLLRR